MNRPTGPAHWHRSIAAMLAAAALLCAGPLASAQVLLDKLPAAEGVGIVEKRGAEVPASLTFRDAFGRERQMGEFFDGRRPVLLVMAYYDCPLLCGLMLNRVQRVLNELSWTAGEDFHVITVSFDHTNTVAQARSKQQVYLAGYNRQVPESAWEFMTGDVENIRALASAVGYHYKFLPESGEFSHPSAIIVIAPDGKVHNYIEKLDFQSMEVRLALAEAAEGRIGTIFDRVFALCFNMDPTTGRYTADAMNIMRIGASSGAVLLAIFIGYWVWWRAKRFGSADVGAPVG